MLWRCGRATSHPTHRPSDPPRAEQNHMKQKLDEARTLAIKLFEAGQEAKRKFPPEIFGDDAFRQWRDLPSESVAVWDAVAICAFRKLNKTT